MRACVTALMLTATIALAGCSREVSTEGPPPEAPAPPAAPAAPAPDEGSGDPSEARRAAKSSAAAAETSSPRTPRARAPEYREVTIPAGTVLPVELQTPVASDTSEVEDAVRGTLRRAVVVDGAEALPAGTPFTGTVTVADRSARVKGRARVGFRFTHVDPPGDAERLAIRASGVTVEAEATKKQDAAKIGGGAIGGAIVGGILGGGDGAAKGAAIGGAAGTGVVLSTRGREVRLAPGTPVSVKLSAPLTVRLEEGKRQKAEGRR
jgi:hypothetical protein